MESFKLLRIFALQGILLVAACSAPKQIPVQTHTINLSLIKEPQANRYVNLDYGIRIDVNDGRSNTRVLTKYDASAVGVPQVSVNPEVVSFVSESARRYMRTMGFRFEADIATDYLMEMNVKEYNLGYLSGVGWSATVQLNVKVFDRNRKLVYPDVVSVGRFSSGGSANDFVLGTKVMNQAYVNALEDIDWDRIAFFLKRSTPRDEPNKQVTGGGNTALEHLTLHWNVDSRPQGADISWRVVSSTPDVKNQNYRYLSTSPYESIETFDIKGLTYNNAGDVQIEIKCEKTGYYTQSKRFSVLSAIEEKDISAMFRLVKEE